MWKADTKGIHHGKEVELQNSAIKMFEGAKLGSGSWNKGFHLHDGTASTVAF